MFKFDRTLAPGEIIGTAVYRSAQGTLVPAATARVTLENSALSFTTDKHGAFALTGLPAGTFNVDVVDSPGGEVIGMVGLRLTDLMVAAADGLDLGQIELQALGAIQGSVALDGNPIGPGAIAAISGLAQVPVSDGKFLFAVLLPGTYPVSVFYQDNPGVLVSPPTTVQVNPASTAKTMFSLSSQSMAAPGAVQGLVQVSGASDNSNVDVQFSGGGPDLTTSSSGTFASGGVPAGIYTVTASLGGFASVSVPDVLVGVGTAVVPNITLLPVTAVPQDAGTGNQGTPPTGCLVDSECPASEVCIAGNCRGAGSDGGTVGCQQTSCLPGEICGTNGACQPLGDGGMVTTCYQAGCSGTATCGIDGQCHPYPTGGSGASCLQLFDCAIVDCGLGNACAQVCEAEGSATVLMQYDTVATCLGMACALPDGGACLTNGIACNQCVSSAINGTGTCVSQYGACETGTPSDGGLPSCVQTGCPPGFACSPATGACTSMTTNPDAGRPVETCFQILQCVSGLMCSLSDDTCIQTCETDAGAHALADFAALDSCVTGACPTVDGGVCATQTVPACQSCENQASAQSCAAQYTTCMGSSGSPDAGSPSCQVTGCPANFACDTTSDSCVPSGNFDGGLGGETCTQLFDCVTSMSCAPSDSSCVDACTTSGSAQAQSEFSALDVCLAGACPSDADGGVCITMDLPCQACESTAYGAACAAPYDNCVGGNTGDGGALPCQVAGCPSGFTCQPSGLCSAEGFGDGGVDAGTGDGGAPPCQVTGCPSGLTCDATGLCSFGDGGVAGRDAGTGATSCDGIIECGSACAAGDSTCQQACIAAGTPTAQSEYNILVTCVITACPLTGDGGLGQDAGAAQACDIASESDGGTCAGPTNTCFGGAQVPDAGPSTNDAGTSGSPPDAGATCDNGLTFSGSPIATTTHAGAPPTLLGGTAPSGQYSLTADDAYNGEVISTTEQWTISISGAQVQWASESSSQATAQYFDGTLKPMTSSSFTLNFSCPATAPAEIFQYMSSTGEVMLTDPTDPNLIHTFRSLP